MESTDYTLENGRIVDPGKFEGEPAWAPYFWDLGLDGGASEDCGPCQFFILTQGDRERFPDLADTYGIGLEESEQGFVYSEVYETLGQYHEAVDRAEESEEMEDA